jgi:hypothetical protein
MLETTRGPGYFDQDSQAWMWEPIPVATVSTATPEEWAWAAGLFEGEGCVYYERRKSANHRTRVCLALRITDKDVIDHFVRVVGVGNCTQVKHHRTWKPHWKEAWDWRLTNFGGILMLEQQFRPWLGERRSAKFLEAITKYAPVAPGGLRKTHCKRGHPLAGPGADVRVSSAHGYLARQCRKCERITSKRIRDNNQKSQPQLPYAY